MNYHLRLLGEPPMPPPDADFAFEIDFKKGEGDPRRVFDAASTLIDAFEVLDKALVESIDVKIAPLMVLEDVEGGSIKVFLKNVLSRIDDEALKTGDWKMLVGHYLVKAKYITLEWCDKDRPASISDLRDGLRRLAVETDVKHLPDYAPIHEGRLLTALERIQKAKGELDSGDRLTIESNGDMYEVNLAAQWDTSEIEAVSSEQTTTSQGEIILTIRKPDFIRDTQWQFTFGGNPVSARIFDTGWLERFHKREELIAPGDALRCKVRFTYQYDDSGTLIDQKISIDQILEIIRGHGTQTSLI